MPNILYIDSSDNKKITIGVSVDGKRFFVSEDTSILRSEAALPLVDKICKENNVNIFELDEIKVNTGPGSFTGLRVGISIANALSFLLKIPINGKKIFCTIFFYQKSQIILDQNYYIIRYFFH
jgi:tRNA threonylcarbamoyladenosine biosynthesis protein TsaB